MLRSLNIIRIEAKAEFFVPVEKYTGGEIKKKVKTKKNKGHPVVSRKTFLKYRKFQKKGECNPLMLGVIMPSEFNYEVMVAIIKNYDYLVKIYC